MTVSLEDIQDKLIPISAASGPTHVIAPLPPSQDTTPDQIAYFNRPNSIPFVRHSPLPAAANAQINAVAKTIAEQVVSESAGTQTVGLDIPDIFTPTAQTVKLPGPLEFGLAPEDAQTVFSGPLAADSDVFLDSDADADAANSVGVSVTGTPLSNNIGAIFINNLSGTSTPGGTTPINPGAGWTSLATFSQGDMYAMSVPVATPITAAGTLANSCAWTAGLLFFGLGTGATIPAIRQTLNLASGATTTSSPMSGTFASPVLAGSIILIVNNAGGGLSGSVDSFVAITGPSDNLGTKYGLIINATGGNGGASPTTFQSQLTILAGQIKTPGSCTVSATANAITPTGGGGFFAGAFQVIAYEITGLGNPVAIPTFKPISELLANVSDTVESLNTLTGDLSLTSSDSSITITPGTNTVDLKAATSGGSPGGTTGDIQINNGGGVFGVAPIGSASLTGFGLTVTNMPVDLAAGSAGNIVIRSDGNVQIDSNGSHVLIGTTFNSSISLGGTSSPVGIGGSSSHLAFYGGTLTTQQTITGSRGGNAALANLLTAFATFGLIVDSTTP